MARHASLVRLIDRYWEEALALGVGGAVAAVIFSQPWLAFAALLAAAGVTAVAARRAGAQAALANDELIGLREDVARHRRRAAYEDIETGLGTATQLEVAFTKQVARHQRWSEDFALVVLQVNDASKVDRPLQTLTASSIARGLLLVARSEDTVCRLDNWTFAVLLSASTREGAEAFIARARTRVSATSHPGDQGEVFVTMRGGVAAWHEGITTMADMLAEADGDIRRFSKELRRQALEFAADTDSATRAG